MGFKPSIDKILSYIPRERQTLLFSATVPPTVRNIASNALRPGYAYVDCVVGHDMLLEYSTS
jgi:ATP-dependent RNA helicase MSS116